MFSEYVHMMPEKVAKLICMEYGERPNLSESNNPFILQKENGVAVMKMDGVFVPWETSCHMSTPLFSQAIKEIKSDDSIQDVVILANSGGGYAEGVDELAKEIYDLGKVKNTHGVITGTCASACYYSLSQCNSIHAETRTSMIGSIGTYLAIEDSSGYFEQMGIKVIPIKTGDLKGAGMMGAKVTDEQINYFQDNVNKLQQFFEESVSRGRSQVKIEEVNSGAVFFADKAIELGLIDGYKTKQAVVDEIMQKRERDAIVKKAHNILR